MGKMKELLEYSPLINLFTIGILVPIVKYIIRIEKKIAEIETTLMFVKEEIKNLKEGQ